MWTWQGDARPCCALCSQPLASWNWFSTCGECFAMHKLVTKMGRQCIYQQHQQHDYYMADYDEPEVTCGSKRKKKKNRMAGKNKVDLSGK